MYLYINIIKRFFLSFLVALALIFLYVLDKYKYVIYNRDMNEDIKFLIHDSLWNYYYICGYNRLLNMDYEYAYKIYLDEDARWEDYEEDRDKCCEKCAFYTGIPSMFLDDECILNRMGIDYDCGDFPVPSMELTIVGEDE